MRDILAEIVEKKKDIVREAKERLPLAEVKARLRPGTFRMAERFRAEPWSLIAECKLQSPAKGRLNRTHTVDQLARILRMSSGYRSGSRSEVCSDLAAPLPTSTKLLNGIKKLKQFSRWAWQPRSEVPKSARRQKSSRVKPFV